MWIYYIVTLTYSSCYLILLYYIIAEGFLVGYISYSYKVYIFYRYCNSIIRVCMCVYIEALTYSSCYLFNSLIFTLLQRIFNWDIFPLKYICSVKSITGELTLLCLSARLSVCPTVWCKQSLSFKAFLMKLRQKSTYYNSILCHYMWGVFERSKKIRTCSSYFEALLLNWYFIVCYLLEAEGNTKFYILIQEIFIHFIK